MRKKISIIIFFILLPLFYSPFIHPMQALRGLQTGLKTLGKQGVKAGITTPQKPLPSQEKHQSLLTKQKVKQKINPETKVSKPITTPPNLEEPIEYKGAEVQGRITSEQLKFKEGRVIPPSEITKPISQTIKQKDFVAQPGKKSPFTSATLRLQRENYLRIIMPKEELKNIPEAWQKLFTTRETKDPSLPSLNKNIFKSNPKDWGYDAYYKANPADVPQDKVHLDVFLSPNSPEITQVLELISSWNLPSDVEIKFHDPATTDLSQLFKPTTSEIFKEIADIAKENAELAAKEKKRFKEQRIAAKFLARRKEERAKLKEKKRKAEEAAEQQAQELAAAEIKKLEEEMFAELDLLRQKEVDALKKELEEMETVVQEKIQEIDQDLKDIEIKLQKSTEELEQLQQKEKEIAQEQQEAQNKHTEELTEQRKLQNLAAQELAKEEQQNLQEQEKQEIQRKLGLEEQLADSELQYKQSLEKLQREQTQAKAQQQIEAKERAKQKDALTQELKFKDTERQAELDALKQELNQTIKEQAEAKTEHERLLDQQKIENIRAQQQLAEQSHAELKKFEQQLTAQLHDAAHKKAQSLDKIEARAKQELETIEQQGIELSDQQKKDLAQRKATELQRIETESTAQEAKIIQNATAKLAELKQQEQLRIQNLKEQKETIAAKFAAEITQIEEAELAELKQQEKLRAEAADKEKQRMQEKYAQEEAEIAQLELEQQKAEENLEKIRDDLRFAQEKQQQSAQEITAVEKPAELQAAEKVVYDITKQLNETRADFEKRQKEEQKTKAKLVTPEKEKAKEESLTETKEKEEGGGGGDAQETEEPEKNESPKELTQEEANKVIPEIIPSLELSPTEKIESEATPETRASKVHKSKEKKEKLISQVPKTHTTQTIHTPAPVAPLPRTRTHVSSTAATHQPSALLSSTGGYTRRRQPFHRWEHEKPQEEKQPYGEFSPRYGAQGFEDTTSRNAEQQPYISGESYIETTPEEYYPTTTNTSSGLQAKLAPKRQELPQAPMLIEKQLPQEEQQQSPWSPFPKKERPPIELGPELRPLPELSWFQKLVTWIVEYINKFFGRP